MQRQLIWDVPTRVLHWTLTAGLGTAFVIAQFGGEHGRFFDYHALLGVALVGVVLLRIAWGIVGTRHARIASFVLSPSRLVGYLRGVATGKSIAYDGHNPATSWAAVFMLALFACVAGTGILMGVGVEAAEELHSLSVYALLGVIAAHVLGVLLHTVQQREMLVVAMIDGRKQASPDAAVRSARPLAGLVMIAIIAAFSGGLYANYDAATHHTHIPLLGTTIQLGEGEDGGDAGGEGTPVNRAGDKDDD